MQQYITQNIQPVVYDGNNLPLTFSYILSQSSILNGSIDTASGTIIETTDSCLPKGLNIQVAGPTTTIDKNITSLNQNGTTVTTISANHGFVTGNKIIISGSSNTALNGQYTITVIDNNTFTYTVSTSGTSNITGSSLKASKSTTTISNVPIKPDLLVWITGLGAYITKEGFWMPVPEITNLLNNSTKIYTTDKNGSYLVYNVNNIADPYNQIKSLSNNEGYLVISNKNGLIPNYYWYDSLGLSNNIDKKPTINFMFDQCATNTPANDNQKTATIGDLGGSCDEYRKASVVLSMGLNNLESNYDYNVVFSSDNKNVVFENDNKYVSNNRLSKMIIDNRIELYNDLTNNITTINATLYQNDTPVSMDTISIYCNCPQTPSSTTPAPLKPRFYLIGEG